MKSRPRPRIALSARFVLAAIVLPLLCGCGQNPADVRASVSGAVTLDGEPLKEGRIKFVPAQGPVSGGDIIDGSYNIPVERGVAFGKNRVEINSTRKSSQKIRSAFSDEMIDATEEAVPDKYNRNSVLECDVKKGPNTFDFTLQSADAKK